MTDPLSTLIIRPGEPGDFDKVYPDWLLSFAKSDLVRYLTPMRKDWAERASDAYWALQREIIGRLLKDAELWVASWAEQTWTVAGWCVLKGSTVHYVYVSKAYRRKGIAKRLLAPALEHRDVTYTHWSKLCSDLPIPPGWTFNPGPAWLGSRKETDNAAQVR